MEEKLNRLSHIIDRIIFIIEYKHFAMIHD